MNVKSCKIFQLYQGTVFRSSGRNSGGTSAAFLAEQLQMFPVKHKRIVFQLGRIRKNLIHGALP